jgi:cobyrinic acid a,c-diamide synthase
LKDVDAQEVTLRFWQEIYDEQSNLVEVHEKVPVDTGHRKVQDTTITITKQTVADKIAAYLRHDISLAELASWAEDAMMNDDFAEDETSTIAAVVARLGVADVRAFGLAWEDCEQLLRQLGYAARVDIVAA